MITIAIIIVVWLLLGVLVLTRVIKREAAKNQATFPILPPMSFFEWLAVVPSMILIAFAAFVAVLFDPLY